MRALIVDDERLARRELRYLLQAHPQVEVVAEAGSVTAAADAVERHQPDLVFLDVQMPGETGFDLFERTALAAHVIFVTAHDEFAVRAFEVNALDYLMKPVNPVRLRQALERATDRRPQGPVVSATRRLAYEDSVFLSIDQAPRFVRLASIVSIRAEGDYTRLVGTAGQIGLVLKTMKEWEALLPERHFCRIQRSVIINCGYVLRLEPWFNSSYQVYLQHTDQPITMSRRLARRFRGRFGV
jgi:two-component system, LytTR family, response regulator